ncbi:Tannase/feruloyl esterase [Boeremia exigua]|uniref:Tannase/feruloyl esterase n=1 Tax=Boeremia exigua TaxID=749465 RepID=UPI001E8D298B|nr:Tannase/feruloyl esterase [Boeremia exigua]KAH6642732.1 Tannase/feruloyl esterase [Boeremia exigua]
MVALTLGSFLSLLALVDAYSVDKVKTKSGSFSTKCSGLASKIKIPGGTVAFTAYITANTTLQFPESDPSCTRPSQAVSIDLCRVGLNISTSARSSIRMEAWLPQNWSGRFLSVGNGGLGGCIQYEDIEYAASLGFAAVGTNNGHDGTTGQSFLNNPEVIADYAYRAVHTGVLAGKDISRTFYGKKHRKSYYLGCSTGGRQGFKSIQDFPDDFDGVAAGAPAFAFNNLTSWSSSFYSLTGPPTAPTFVPASLWPVVHQDVLKQCDSLDGAADGILESPDLCDYDPSGLLCTAGQNSSSCLTSQQVETVRKVFSPIYDDEGSLVYPRLQPGAEAAEAPFSLLNGQRSGSSDWFSYAIFNDSNWDPLTLKPSDYRISSGLNLFNIETWNGDLSSFKRRAGKVIHYHGLQDGIIPDSNSPRYYEHVSKTMNQTPEQLDSFYRYFRISGMMHCGGGLGAAAIGNMRRNMGSLDPQENVLTALVRWVEEGIAPDTITGTAFNNGTADSGVDFKRKHCRWPYRNIYKGPGDFKNPDSWKCVLDA